MADKLPRTPRIVFGFAGFFNIVVGFLLFMTTGMQGFTGREEALLFQIVAVFNVVMGVAGVLGVLQLCRPSRRTAFFHVVLLFLSGIGLILVTLFPVGILNLVLGVAAFIMRRRIPD